MARNTRAFLAHSGNHGDCTEPLTVHLGKVAERAQRFAVPFGAGDHAYLAGLLHDLGKYADRFQRYLRQGSGDRPGNHATMGALLAIARYGENGVFPATAIDGHHGGMDFLLTRPEAGRRAEAIHRGTVQVTEASAELLLQRLGEDGIALPAALEGFAPNEMDADDMLDARMLFSALVDADFLETEAHFEGNADCPRRYRPTGPPLDASRALRAVADHVAELQCQGSFEDPMNAMRQALRQACLKAAELPPGLLTLSAPTGAGKTLAMLTFALAHAAKHDLGQIVLVMPYLNIIDQTARLYQEVFSAERGFPEGYVLEDHSLAAARQEDGGEESDEQGRRLRRLLSENWDAPIILTTNVKCLESLMSNRPGACRKLHRLARSVLLFDEVQTLPRHLAPASLAGLSRLSNRYSASIVLATATQPAFEQLDASVREVSSAGWQPKPLVPAEIEAQMYQAAAGRTEIHWDHQTPMTLEALANRLAHEPAEQWMCIVNLKRHATALVELLRLAGIEHLAHLSTAMCPRHRQDLLGRIRSDLDPASPQPVRLVSTQCVEAGVDVDFAAVYRAMAPLEAIAQAAGRCNRHGRRGQAGRVCVFKPDPQGRALYPPGAYAHAADVTEAFVTRKLRDGIAPEAMIHDPRVMRAYFRELYALAGTDLGADAGAQALRKAMAATNFRKVAQIYRLIDAQTVNVLVPYNQTEFDRLREEILASGPRRPGALRQWIARARPLTVTVYATRLDGPLRQHLEPVYFSPNPASHEQPDWYLALPSLQYDTTLGLVVPKEMERVV